MEECSKMFVASLLCVCVENVLIDRRHTHTHKHISLPLSFDDILLRY